jgi:nucleoside-diphosphate-sugar epimerase
MKLALVTGAGGMIGHQMVKALKAKGYWVRGVDIKHPEYSASLADEFIIGDLRDPKVCQKVTWSPNQRSLNDKENSFDECYHFAAQMGGAIFVFSGDYDAEIIHDSALININTIHYSSENNIKKIFLASSACVYNEHKQDSPDNIGLKESDAWPAHPDSAYGREKLFMEEVADAYYRNRGLQVRVGRFHNIFSEELAWKGDRPKAPAAICRKVAEVSDGGAIEIFGDGLQTRSFLYISEALEGVFRLMESNFVKPINIGSDEIISINDLAYMVADIAGKKITINHIDGPLGVRGRNSDNTLIYNTLGWKPSEPLRDGMEKLYRWVNSQVIKDEKL